MDYRASMPRIDPLRLAFVVRLTSLLTDRSICERMKGSSLTDTRSSHEVSGGILRLLGSLVRLTHTDGAVLSALDSQKLSTCTMTRHQGRSTVITVRIVGTVPGPL